MPTFVRVTPGVGAPITAAITKGNGQSARYSCALGSSILVPSDDVPMLQAAGWQRYEAQDDPGIWGKQADFEYQLSIKGAVFDGTTDDAPAIQAALDAIAADGKFHQVRMPDVALQASLGSLAGGSHNSITSCLALPVNVAVDFRGMSLLRNNAVAAGHSVLRTKSGLAVTPSYGQNRAVYERFAIVGRQDDDYAIHLGAPTDNGAPRVCFRDAYVFNTFHGIQLGSNSYLQKFQNVEFNGLGGNAFGDWSATVNSGENVTFYGCAFYNGNQHAINVARSFLNFFGCSFDYNIGVVDMQPAAGAWVSANFIGCHFEQNDQDARYSAVSANNVAFRIGANGTKAKIVVTGGELVVVAGTGNQLGFVFDPGNTGVGAGSQYGISVKGLWRDLGGRTVVINRAAATGGYSLSE